MISGGRRKHEYTEKAQENSTNELNPSGAFIGDTGAPRNTPLKTTSPMICECLEDRRNLITWRQSRQTQCSAVSSFQFQTGGPQSYAEQMLPAVSVSLQNFQTLLRLPILWTGNGQWIAKNEWWPVLNVHSSHLILSDCPAYSTYSIEKHRFSTSVRHFK